MSPAAFEHTCASFRAALISGAQRDDTDDLRAMLDDGYVSVPRDMTRAIRSAALGVALMRACERGSADAVVVMLDHGAEHSRANARGDTPLHVAACEGAALAVWTTTPWTIPANLAVPARRCRQADALSSERHS